MRVLLADDDSFFGSAVQTSLQRLGYAADFVCTGSAFEYALATNKYDCALLDLGLPDTCGCALLKRIRQNAQTVSVIVITARRGIKERIEVLDAGADDYLVKPIDLDEVAARIRAVVRRVAVSADHLRHGAHCGPLELLPDRCSAQFNGRPIALTRKEYRVLEKLVHMKDQVVSRAQLEDSLYGWGDEIDSNTVEVYVHFLRRKISPDIIQTVRGVGYQLASLTAWAGGERSEPSILAVTRP